jgi:dihydroxyacetone kinase
LLLLPRSDEAEVSKSDVISLLDAPSDAPGWIPLFAPRSIDSFSLQSHDHNEEEIENTGASVSCKIRCQANNTAEMKTYVLHGFPYSVDDYEAFKRALTAAAENVIEAEPEITRFDTIAGDGDCGTW